MRGTLVFALLALPLASLACNGGGQTGDADATADGETTQGDGDGDSTSDDSTTGPEIPDCTPGAFGCECAEGDSCSPDLACVAGMCTFDDCPPGWDGCPCGEGDSCMQEEQFCVEGICGCLPGTVGCSCDAGACDGELECIAEECWLMSPYPGCGWLASNEYYYCGSDIAHPDYPIECPPDLVEGEACPPELTFIGCCDMTGTFWCGNGTIAYMACG